MDIIKALADSFKPKRIETLIQDRSSSGRRCFAATNAAVICGDTFIDVAIRAPRLRRKCCHQRCQNLSTLLIGEVVFTQGIDFIGERAGTRTQDLLIKSEKSAPLRNARPTNKIDWVLTVSL